MVDGDWKNCNVTCAAEHLVSAELVSRIWDTYLSDAVEYIQRGIRVLEPLNGTWTVNSAMATCGDDSSDSGGSGGSGSASGYSVNIPSRYYTEGVKEETDLLVFVTVRPMQRDLLSIGMDCLREPDGSGRPRIGVINLSPKIVTIRADIRHLVIAHELLHIMGFSERIYGSDITYRTRTVNDDSRSIATLNYGRLVEVAREYFACPTLAYVPLENYGDETATLRQNPWLHTKNNHWEERIFRSELMTGTFMTRDPVDPAISVLTLALLESLGWYWVDYHQYMHDYSFGRGYGCDFVEKDCSALRWDSSFRSGYFCDGSKNSMSCTFDHIAKASCETRYSLPSGLPAYYQHFGDSTTFGGNAHADYCTNYQPITTADCRFAINAPSDADKYGETYSMRSRCFVSDAVRNADAGSVRLDGPMSRCHEFACEDGSTLYVRVGSVWVICPAAGGKIDGKISGFQGHIYCPPVDVLCPFNITTDNFREDIKHRVSDQSIWDAIASFLADVHYGVWIAVGSAIGIVLIVLGLIVFLLVLRHRKSRRWKVKRVVDVEKENQEEMEHVDIEH